MFDYLKTFGNKKKCSTFTFNNAKKLGLTKNLTKGKYERHSTKS